MKNRLPAGGCTAALFLLVAIAAALLLSRLAWAQWAGDLPNARTPGAIEDDNPEIVCAADYIAERGTEAPEIEQRKAFFRYAVPWESRDRYVADHLIPVGLGGSHDTTNLWPQHVAPAFSYNVRLKDQLEAQMRREVCQLHTLSLAAAQAEIAADWIAAYKRRFAARPQ